MKRVRKKGPCRGRRRQWCAALCVLLCAALSALTLAGCASRGESPDAASRAAMSAEEEQHEEVLALDCDPLTGAAKAEGAVDGQRPVAVMINNLREALPQSGIAAASVVYEMVTEGGITRLMAVYHSTAELGRVGPVRSTRDQFLQLAIPENFILLHIGSSIYAADLQRTLGYASVDGIYLGTVAFAFDAVRAQGRANEHCFYTGAALADAGIAHEGLPTTGTVNKLFCFVPYDQPARTPAGGPAADAAFSFSEYDGTSLHYDADAGRYFKSEFGDPQMDEATGEQLSYTNVFLLGCDIGLKGDGLCTDFDFTGGKGFYLTRGAWEPVTWTKGAAAERLTVRGADGQELYVNVGTSYVAFVDARALKKTLTIDGASPYAPAGSSAGSSAASAAESVAESAAADSSAG